MPTIRFKRGNKSNLPKLNEGEPAFTKDTKEVFIGGEDGNIKLVSEDEMNGEIQSLQSDVNSKNEQREADIGRLQSDINSKNDARIQDIAKLQTDLDNKNTARVSDIQKVDNRVSTIVASAGNSNTEIVDARGGLPTLRDRLNNTDAQLASIVTSVKNYNAVGDGVTSDVAPITNAKNTLTKIFIPKGTFLIDSNITFDIPVSFAYGAVFKIRNGAVVTFNKGIEAGWYTIFDTEDDFINNFTGNPSVVIYNCVVKADWFCSKVLDLELIKTIPDQTNNLIKAYRAAVGNFVPVGSNYETSISEGVLELGFGFYRLDKQFTMGKSNAGVYHRTDGFRLTGQGVMSSYLVRTDMAALDYGIYLLYTGQLTNLDNFKITAYNPDGTNSTEKYSSATKAMMFVQGDSLQIKNIWVAGAQVSVQDANGYYRNGIAVQFSSCIDTYFTDIFVENCVTGMAFGSSTVSGTNLELYSIRKQALATGVIIDGWNSNAAQTTSSKVNISNIQSKAVPRGITALETGTDGFFNIAQSYFDGYNSEFGTQDGYKFLDMCPGSVLSGSISQCNIRNFNSGIFAINDNCSLGTLDRPFFIMGVTIKGQTVTPSTGVIYGTGTGSFANIIANGLSASDINGILLLAPFGGRIALRDVNLKNYKGQSSTSTSRSLFVTGAAGTTIDIDIRRVKRDSADTTALTQYGFANGGTIFLDVDNLPNATRIINGSGFTAQMPSKVTFA